MGTCNLLPKKDVAMLVDLCNMPFFANSPAL